MADDFAAQVEAWVTESVPLMEGVYRESVQRVVEIMQTPGPSKASVAKQVATGGGLGKNGRASKKAMGPVKPGNLGGRLPVDTGFLWHSFQISFDGPPPLRENPTSTTASYTYEPGAVNATITNASIEQPLYGGYGAKYAAKVNYSYGYMFLDMAIQQWPQIVERVVQDLKGRMANG
jgi:hypothetical protein